MPRKEKETPKVKKPRETTAEFLASLAEVLVVGLFIITFVMQAFAIPSGLVSLQLLSARVPVQTLIEAGSKRQAAIEI